MAFISNADAVARNEMIEVNPELADKYVSVIQFLSLYPDAASKLRGTRAPAIGSADYIARQAKSFSQGRSPKPTPPTTIPDEMVSFVLVSHFGIEQSQVEKIKREHQLSMGAENAVGDLLEVYIASVIEEMGWVWCSGSMVKAVDFIKPPTSSGESWRLLQVKNRNNSENSSASAIRDGTTIEKWHRTFSRRVGSNWDAFPDTALQRYLSEEGFKQFVRDYLNNLN